MKMLNTLNEKLQWKGWIHRKLSKTLKDLEQRINNKHRSAILNVIALVDGDLSGAWVCHSCQHKNNATILPGEHPFGILVCDSCDHIWCEDCRSSRVLQRWHAGQTHIYFNGKHTEFPYVFMCIDCGLTLRAAIEHEVETELGTRVNWGWPTKCACGGTPSPEKWACFKIREGVHEGLGVEQLLLLLKRKMDHMEQIESAGPGQLGYYAEL